MVLGGIALDVLVVDDDERNCKGLVRAIENNFRHLNVRAFCAHSIELGLELARGLENLALVVLDLSYKDSAPHETLNRVTEFARIRGRGVVPVIGCTGVDDPSLIEDGYRKGLFNFIIKGTGEVSQMEKIGLALEKFNPGRGAGHAVFNIRRNARGTKVREWWSKNGIAAAAFMLALLGTVSTAGSTIWAHTTKSIQSEEALAAKLKEHDDKFVSVEKEVATLKQSVTDGFGEIRRTNEQLTKVLGELSAKADVSSSERQTNRSAIVELRKEMTDRLDGQNKMLFELLKEVRKR